MAEPDVSHALEVETPSSLRARLSRIINPGATPQNPELEPVLRTLRQFHPKSDVKMVTHAYLTAEYLHRDQKRRSGDPYISHPVAVAQILADLGMTAPTLAAALLHDTVEDTDYSLEDLRARSSATRSPPWSTASPSSTRSRTGRPAPPRRSARWSWRWPATSGSW